VQGSAAQAEGCGASEGLGFRTSRHKPCKGGAVCIAPFAACIHVTLTQGVRPGLLCRALSALASKLSTASGANQHGASQAPQARGNLAQAEGCEASKGLGFRTSRHKPCKGGAVCIAPFAACIHVTLPQGVRPGLLCRALSARARAFLLDSVKSPGRARSYLSSGLPVRRHLYKLQTWNAGAGCYAPPPSALKSVTRLLRRARRRLTSCCCAA